MTFLGILFIALGGIGMFISAGRMLATYDNIWTMGLVTSFVVMCLGGALLIW